MFRAMYTYAEFETALGFAECQARARVLVGAGRHMRKRTYPQVFGGRAVGARFSAHFWGRRRILFVPGYAFSIEATLVDRGDSTLIRARLGPTLYQRVFTVLAPSLWLTAALAGYLFRNGPPGSFAGWAGRLALIAAVFAVPAFVREAQRRADERDLLRERVPIRLVEQAFAATLVPAGAAAGEARGSG